MNLTVDRMAAMNYAAYLFSGSAAAVQNAMDPEQLSRSDFGVSDLTDALDALSQAQNAGPYTTSLDRYVRSQLQLSQLSEYDALSGMASDAGGFFTAGTVSAAAANGYLEDKLGLDGSTFNLDGVTDAGTAARTAYLAGRLSGTDDGTLSAYRKYMEDNPPGSILDILG